MGLRQQLQKAAVTAFKAAGNVARPATYKSLTGEVTRDLDAGTSVPVTVDYPLKRTIFSKFKETENDKDISILTDEKFMFASLELPIEPKSADIVIDENNRQWEIIKRLSDPASAVVILLARTSR